MKSEVNLFDKEEFCFGDMFKNIQICLTSLQQAVMRFTEVSNP